MSRGKDAIAVLYSDQWLLAVNKPSGVSCTRGRGDDVALTELLARQLPRDDDRPLLNVHRIDKPVTGVVLIARDAEAHRRLSRQFERSETEKTYLALVRGELHESAGQIEARIAPKPGDSRVMTVVPRRGKRSVLAWEVVGRFRGATLLKVHPLTGRTHQIRVMLSHMGFPLLVDELYGGGERLMLSSFKRGYRRSRRRPERPLIARVSLHAWRVVLRHPITAERLKITAPVPRDFAAAVKQLAKYAPLEPIAEPARLFEPDC